MVAFTFSTSFITGSRYVRKSVSRCTHGYRTPSRVVRAVISEEKSTDTFRRDLADLEPFNWVENWYPILAEEDAPVDEPYAFTLFDSNYVMFRIAPGRWSVLDDRCSHRLAPLSEGRIVHDASTGDAEIECAYHGWGFNGCGGCTRIPQLETGARIPKRADVRSYHTVVEIGIVWMYLGKWSDKPPTPPLPEVRSKFSEDVRKKSRVFMRIVPYGYETLMENVLDPEHLHWAHHNVGNMNRKNGGKEVLAANFVSGKHELRIERSGLLPMTIPGSFVPPCMMYIEFDRPGFRGMAVFLVMPSKRRECRLFNIPVAEIGSPIVRFMNAIKPRYASHLVSLTILDGDTILLRGMERELGDPSNWKTKFLALEKSSDAYIVRFREWMDSNRHGMPWTSPDLPMQSMSGDEAIERFHSHVEHCKSCMTAFKRIEKAVVITHVLARILSAALICLIVTVSVGNIPVAFQAGTLRIEVVAAVLIALLSLVIAVHKYCTTMKSQFLLTDKARKLMLAP